MIGDIIIANVIASACLVLLVYLLDINEKEPPWTLVRLYVITILVTLLFGKLKAFLFAKYEWEFSLLFSNFVVAGFFEELLKFSIVLVFVWPLKSFNEETDGIIYFLIVAAGFTVLENLGYAFRFVISPYVWGVQSGQMGPYRTALQNIVVLRAVSGHVFINVVSGFFVGLAKRRHRWWLLIPGFLLSVLLHGTWNQTASMGLLVYYVLLFLVLDVAIFIFTLRMSFYHKFMKRLKFRIKELILEAKKKKLDLDLITLMDGIKRNAGALRRMEGDILNAQAKEITELLPSRLDEVRREGEGGLIERLLRINGILTRDRLKTGVVFWIRLFFMFSATGFLVLLVLMELM